MIFLRNDDGSISVDGGAFAPEAEVSVHLIGQAGPLLETTIRVTTREATAVYLVDGAQPLGASSLHARLVRVETACNNCGMRHAPDDKAACIEGHGDA